jgi:hypothetical protein
MMDSYGRPDSDNFAIVGCTRCPPRQIAPWTGAMTAQECECEPGTYNKSLLSASSEEVILLMKTADTFTGSTSDVCAACPGSQLLTCYGSIHGPQFPSPVRNGGCAAGHELVPVVSKSGSSRIEGFSQETACAACQPHSYKSTTTAERCTPCPTGTEVKKRGSDAVSDCDCFRGYVRDEQNETGACRVGEACTNFSSVVPPFRGSMGSCPVNGTLRHSQVCYLDCPDHHQPYLTIDEPPYFEFPQLLILCNDGVLNVPKSMPQIVCSKEAYETVLVFFLGSVGLSALVGGYLVTLSHRFEGLKLKSFQADLRREKRRKSNFFRREF